MNTEFGEVVRVCCSACSACSARAARAAVVLHKASYRILRPPGSAGGESPPPCQSCVQRLHFPPDCQSELHPSVNGAPSVQQDDEVQ